MLPWSPYEIVDATSSLISAAPTGTPPPSALPDRDQVRLEAQRAEVERLSGPSEAALDFVGDEQRSGLRARLVDGFGEGGRKRPDPAFTLYRLGDDGRGRGRDGREQGRGIVHGDETHARQQRLERRAIVFVRRDRQCAHRPAVKRFLERDDFGARFAARVPVAARELQTGFDRFRAAVADEDPRQSGQRCQALADLPLERVEEQVRGVQQRLRLIGDGPAPAPRARDRARRRRCPTAGRGTRGPRSRRGARPLPRTKASGARRYVCRTCRDSRA